MTAADATMVLATLIAALAVIVDDLFEPCFALTMRVPSWLVIAGVSMAVSVSQSGCATASCWMMSVASCVLMVVSESGAVSEFLSRPSTKAASWETASSVEPVRGQPVWAWQCSTY